MGRATPRLFIPDSLLLSNRLITDEVEPVWLLENNPAIRMDPAAQSRQRGMSAEVSETILTT